MKFPVSPPSIAVLAVSGLAAGWAGATPLATEPPVPASPPPEQPLAGSQGSNPEEGVDRALDAETASPPKAEAAEAPGDEVGIEMARTRRAPGSLHVLSAEQLERFRYDDPHATLQMVPGVYVRQEDGFGLRPNIGIRGTLSDRSKKVSLLEDGVLFGPAPYSAPAAYYFPILGRIERMEVVKGPSAIAYGPQSVGGAIDLSTRRVGEHLAGQLDLVGGQYGYAKGQGHISARFGRTAISAEAVHLQSSGFKQLPGGQDTGFSRNEVVLKAEHELAPAGALSHRLGLKLTYSDEESNETYLGLTDADFRSQPLRRYGASVGDVMSWTRTSVVASHVWQMTPRLRLSSDAYRHDLSRRWNKVNHFAEAALFGVLSRPDTPGNAPFYQLLDGQGQTQEDGQQLYIGPNQRTYASQGLQSKLEAEFEHAGLRHRVRMGGRLHHDGIERRHTEDAFRLEEGQPVAIADSTIETTANRASTLALSAYALDEVRFDRLTLTPGIRAEWMLSEATDELLATPTRDRSAFVLLGGLGAHYALGDHWGVLAGVHRGMSPPAPGTSASTQPESSINYEAGARYLSGFHRAEVIGYFNDYQNLTDVCTLSGGCDESMLDQQFEAGRARIYGAEALLDNTWLFDSFRVPTTLSYTLTRTEFLETFQSRDPIFGEVEAGDEMPYVPQHQARASIGLEAESWGGYVAGTYSSAMREVSGTAPLDQALATEAFVSVDAGLHYWATSQLKLYTQLRNAGNRQSIVSRRPYGARPSAPRWLQLGATYAWD